MSLNLKRIGSEPQTKAEHNENLEAIELDAMAMQNFMLRRVSSNQSGEVASGALVGWSKISAAVTFSVHMTIATSIPWASRSPEEQEILLALGYLEGAQNFHQPASFNVVKMQWVGLNSGDYTFHQGARHRRDYLISACYAKLLSGEFMSGGMFDGAIQGEWKPCGNYVSPAPDYSGTYKHSHPLVASESGEILLVFPSYIRSPTLMPLDTIQSVGWLRGMHGVNESVNNVGGY